MKIEERKIKIRDLIAGYKEDDSTSRVVALDGTLDVRPEYQREYVYDDKKRDAVINTVLQGFPLNIMYWVDRKDGTMEVLDGQQRIISICRYARNDYSVKIPAPTGGYNPTNYPNLPKGTLMTDGKPEPFTQLAFLEYELTVYVCEGTDKEKLAWFEIINIAGEVLETQEIRNAQFHGPWLTDAKSVFSRKNCAAHKRYGKYMAGEYIRQKYLETVFIWAADAEGVTGKDAVVTYMQKHRHEADANALWTYFENVFKWIETVFGREVDKSMKGVQWGLLYNAHKDDNLDAKYIQRRVKQLLADKEVQKNSGIYQYLLEGETRKAERYLSLRQFDKDDMLTRYHEQEGKCAICKRQFTFADMQGDHRIPWSKGGKTEYSNLDMLCTPCNIKKSDCG